MKFFRRNLWAFAIFIFLNGCSDDDSATGPSTTPNDPYPGGFHSTVIQADDGGQLTYGDFTVIIPEEAIDDWMVLSVGVPEDPPDYAAPSPDFRQIGYTYEAGSTISDFLSGVTVQFVYNDTDLGDLEEAELLIWKYDSLDVVLGEVEQIQIDTTENVISGLTASLAYFVLGG